MIENNVLTANDVNLMLKRCIRGSHLDDSDNIQTAYLNAIDLVQKPLPSDVLSIEKLDTIGEFYRGIMASGQYDAALDEVHGSIKIDKKYFQIGSKSVFDNDNRSPQ